MKKRFVAALLTVLLLLSASSCASYRDVPNDVGKNEYPVEDYRTTMRYYEDFKI